MVLGGHQGKPWEERRRALGDEQVSPVGLGEGSVLQGEGAKGQGDKEGC